MNSPSLEPSVSRKTGRTQRAPRRVVRANWLPTEPIRSWKRRGAERRGAQLARAACGVGGVVAGQRCVVGGLPRAVLRVYTRGRSYEGGAHREAVGVHELLVLVGAEGSEDVGDARGEQRPHREVCQEGGPEERGVSAGLRAGLRARGGPRGRRGRVAPRQSAPTGPGRAPAMRRHEVGMRRHAVVM